MAEDTAKTSGSPAGGNPPAGLSSSGGAAAVDEAERRLILSLMDLTSLNEKDTGDDIAALCAKAVTKFGSPAALCLYKQFLPTAGKILADKGLRKTIRLATVVNFPAGAADAASVAEETAQAVSLGADEVDAVLPYRALMANDVKTAQAVIGAARRASRGKTLKIILESGILHEPDMIRKASELAINEGADFIKTSTGKADVSTTLPAARIMLETIAKLNKDCGFKAAGGVKTAEQAAQYLNLAAEILGQSWIKPEHFRFGASGLLDNLFPPADGETNKAGAANKY